MFSKIRIFPVENSKTLKARGSFLVGDAVYVNFSLMERADGDLWVSLPAKKDAKGAKDEKTGRDKYWPDALFASKDVQEEATKLIVDAYNNQLTSSGNVTRGDTQQTGYTDDMPF